MTDDLTPKEQAFLDELRAKRWRRRKRVALIVGGALLALVLLCVVGALFYGWYWQGKLDAKIAELRARGKLLTWQQVLDRDKDLPPDQNSALVYLKAFDQLQDTPQAQVATWLKGDFGARPSQTAMGLLAAVAESDAQAMATIQSGVPLVEGCYPLDSRLEPWDIPVLEHCEKVRNAVRLCGQLAAFRAADGQPARAVPYIMGSLGLASSFGSKALPIEDMVRVATDALAVRALERCLALCQFTPEDLQTLRARLAREGSDRSLTWGIMVVRSEAHFILSSRDVMVARQMPVRLAVIPGRRQKMDFLYQREAGEADHVATLPPRRALAEMLAHRSSMPGSAYLGTAGWGTFARELKAELAARQQLSVASAALAVEQYRLKNGRWPDSLDELVPEFLGAVPDDYFGPGKIGCRRSDLGVDLYSIGTNNLDYDGAKLNAAGGMVFRLLDPELRGAKTTPFREEVLDGYLGLHELKAAGFDEEALKRLGLTDDDLNTVQSRQ